MRNPSRPQLTIVFGYLLRVIPRQSISSRPKSSLPNICRSLKHNQTTKRQFLNSAASEMQYVTCSSEALKQKMDASQTENEACRNKKLSTVQ
jgi:hypothetical protein